MSYNDYNQRVQSFGLVDRQYLIDMVDYVQFDLERKRQMNQYHALVFHNDILRSCIIILATFVSMN